MTRVLSCNGLRPMTSLKPSSPDRSSTKIGGGSTWTSVDAATQNLHLERHFCNPVKLRKGLSRESISVKLVF
jgi:hypothetical protein